MYRSLCLILAFTMIVGCTSKDQAEATKTSETPKGVPAVPTLPMPEVEKEIRMTAEALTSEFEKNFEGAKKKYDGKVVEVTGPYHRIFPNMWESEPEICMGLRGVSRSGDPGFSTLRCKITAKQFDSDKRLRSLSLGQSITVRGKVQDYRDTSMTDCVIVAVGPSTAIPTTLQEIEAELAKKENDFGRFKDKDLLVKVTFQGMQRGSDTIFEAVRPTNCENSFKFYAYRFGDEYSKELDALKAGDTVLFLARLTKPYGFGIELTEMRLLKTMPEGLKLPEEKK